MSPQIVIRFYTHSDSLLTWYAPSNTVRCAELSNYDPVIVYCDVNNHIRGIEISGVSNISAGRWRAAYNPEFAGIPYDLYDAVLDWLEKRDET